jgi:hypothetical protein
LNEYNIKYILEDNYPITVDTFDGLSSHNKDYRCNFFKNDIVYFITILVLSVILSINQIQIKGFKQFFIIL